MLQDLKRTIIPSKPVPMLWFLLGCIVIVPITLVLFGVVNMVSIVASVILCVAWWSSYLGIIDPAEDLSEAERWEGQSGVNADSYEDQLGTFDGPPTTTGLPTNSSGIDVLGNVYGTDNGSDCD